MHPHLDSCVVTLGEREREGETGGVGGREGEMGGEGRERGERGEERGGGGEGEGEIWYGSQKSSSFM